MKNFTNHKKIKKHHKKIYTTKIKNNKKTQNQQKYQRKRKNYTKNKRKNKNLKMYNEK